MDGGDIVVSLITAGIPSAATVVVAFFQSRTMNKHAARQDILNLITEDYVAYSLMNRMPANKRRILDEFDTYKKNSGNSYLHEKIEEYLAWYKTINDDITKNICKKNGEK